MPKSDPNQSYAESSVNQHKLYKRTLFIIVISQVFGGAGLAAGVTVGALLAQEMLGTDGYAGVPASLFTLGSAMAALLVGRLSQRFGRRNGLASGFITGAVGAMGVVLAAVSDNLALLFVSLFIYGAGTAANLQARYAGTDLAAPTQRAKAVSLAMVSTTFGAVAGPNLIDVMGRFAKIVGVPELAGPFLLASAAFFIAGLVLLVFLRPDPLKIAQAIAHNREAAPRGETKDVTLTEPVTHNRGIILGASVMVLTQIVMAAIMTMTPVHMKHHGHSLSDVGLVIGIHIGAMYLPSLLTGMLVDKLGRFVMMYASGVTLLCAGFVAAIVPGDSMLGLILALALLGLGWNMGMISGTAQIVDATTVTTRAKTQGTIDVLIALSGASGGAISGTVVAGSSFETLSFAGSVVSLLLIPVVILSRKSNEPTHAKQRISS
jgi:MFS family permease